MNKRQDDSERQEEALAKLRTRLDEAVAVFESSAPKTDAVHEDPAFHERQGAAMALEALLDFLRPQLGIRPIRPLLRLLGALADVEKGRSNPLTAPVNRPQSRPQASINQTISRATAVVAVDLLMRAGRSKSEALRRVAPLLVQETLTPKQLGAFRDRLRAGRSERLASELHERMLEIANKQIEDKIFTDEQAAEGLLETLAGDPT